MRRLGVALAVLCVAPAARAEIERCTFEGVRVVVADAGDSSVVELSVRAKSEEGATCTIDWSRVVLGSPTGADASPNIAVAQAFVDHKLTTVEVADGVAAVIPRAYRGPGGSIAVRWIVEGTDNGLRVEIPRAAFPQKAAPGTRVERRVKSARPGKAKFGALGDIDVPPTGPGAAGGIGPAGPLDAERIIAEYIPGGAPLMESVPPPLTTLDAFRDVLPRRVLDLSPAAEEGWSELAKRAYAASLHGDPVVASLGAHTLAWLASGLSIQAVRVSKAPGGPETALAPANVVDAIGDFEARLAKRYGATGRLLPLGRPAIFRKALAAKPWDDAPRAAAAKAAVARLATVQPQDLTPFLVPAIVDGSAAPVDPPQPIAGAPEPIVPHEKVQGEAPAVATVSKTKKRRTGRRFGWIFALLAAGAVVGYTLRESD